MKELVRGGDPDEAHGGAVGEATGRLVARRTYGRAAMGTWMVRTSRLLSTARAATRCIAPHCHDLELTTPQDALARRRVQMMAVVVMTRSELSVGVPEVLFEVRYYAEAPQSGSQLYDVSPDGATFLMIQAVDSTHEVRVVLNWFSELERLVSTDNN